MWIVRQKYEVKIMKKKADGTVITDRQCTAEIDIGKTSYDGQSNTL
jgi:hypothetical protein